MASWIDIFSLVMIALIFVGVILGVLNAAQYISTYIQSAKASLEHRGITFSRDGVFLKTQGRFDREQYVDATQRGFVKALNAATFGPESHKQAFLHVHDGSQACGTPGGNEHELKHVFGAAMRRSHSGRGREEGRAS